MAPRRLSIGDVERGKIDIAMRWARDHVKPLAAVAAGGVNVKPGELLPYAERPTDFKSGDWARHVELPDGYWCAFSFEQQLPGLCKHLSISLMDDNKNAVPGSLPSPEAVAHIGIAFGISDGSIVAKWVEEFEPDCHAINIVALDKGKLSGKLSGLIQVARSLYKLGRRE